MTGLATTDLCDAYGEHVREGQLRVLQPVFQSYGSRRAFSGAIVTVKVFEDNVLVRDMLEEEGHGRVLVVDGGGSMRCSLMGGNMAALAQSNGWSGIVVNGCVRDVDEINRCDIGVRALAAHPLKSLKKGVGEKNGVVYVAGARIVAGEWCCADADGIIVAHTELSL